MKYFVNVKGGVKILEATAERSMDAVKVADIEPKLAKEAETMVKTAENGQTTDNPLKIESSKPVGELA